MGERLEILMRIFVAIVTGIILGIWKIFIVVISVVNWIYTIFAGRRIKGISEMSEIWNTQQYIFVRYMILESNERPFPFRHLTRSISKFDSKKKR